MHAKKMVTVGLVAGLAAVNPLAQPSARAATTPQIWSAPNEVPADPQHLTTVGNSLLSIRTDFSAYDPNGAQLTRLSAARSDNGFDFDSDEVIAEGAWWAVDVATSGQTPLVAAVDGEVPYCEGQPLAFWRQSDGAGGWTQSRTGFASRPSLSCDVSGSLSADDNLAVYVGGSRPLQITRSADGGATWSPLTPLLQVTDPGHAQEHPAVAVSGDNVVVVWSDGRDGEAQTEQYVSQSSDGGLTFSPPMRLTRSPQAELAARVEARGNTMVAAWPVLLPGDQTAIEVVTSNDSGRTWGSPERLRVDPGQYYSEFAPEVARVTLVSGQDGFHLLASSEEGVHYHYSDNGLDWVERGAPPAIFHLFDAGVLPGGVLAAVGRASGETVMTRTVNWEALGKGTARDIDDSCPPGQVPAEPFSDVSAENPHARAVACLLWWGLTTGRTPTTYAPSAPISREAMASFIARTIHAAKPGALHPAPHNVFGDDDDSVHELAINQLALAGIVSGKTEGSYDPRASVTRAQMAKFLVGAVSLILEQPLPDAEEDYFLDDDGSLFENEIGTLALLGVTSGRGERAYKPSEAVTRAQMASFLTRSLDLLSEAGVQPPQ